MRSILYYKSGNKTKANKISRLLARAKKENFTLKSIREIVNKAYNLIPTKYRSFIEDPKQAKTVLTKMIYYDKEKDINPYSAMLQNISHNYEKSGQGTREEIYKMFRTEESQVYNHYNTYVYRLGYSSKKYFMDNVQISQAGSLLSATLELPQKIGGVSYNVLLIEYDWSSGEFTANIY